MTSPLPSPMPVAKPAAVPRTAAPARGAGTAGPSRDAARAKAKAEEFEGVLLGQVVRLMLAGVREGGAFGGGAAEGQWNDVLADEYGKAIAGSGGIGLAARIEAEIRAAMRRPGPPAVPPPPTGEPKP